MVIKLSIKNPCYQCEDRKLYCHSNCTKGYKEYAEEMKRINEKRKEDKMIREGLADLKHNRYKKIDKR